MPARRDPGAKPETKLARVRMSRGVTQGELADAIGISEPTYRRMERGLMTSPPLGYLVNAALALGVELDDVMEDRWRTWHELRADRPARPLTTSSGGARTARETPTTAEPGDGRFNSRHGMVRGRTSPSALRGNIRS